MRIYKTHVRSVSRAVFHPMVWVATQGAGVGAVLVCAFRGAGAADVEHEADVLAVGCLKSIVHPHDDDGTFRMT